MFFSAVREFLDEHGPEEELDIVRNRDIGFHKILPSKTDIGKVLAFGEETRPPQKERVDIDSDSFNTIK